MNTLLILAYNEESHIEKVILNNEKIFDKILIVNDASKDSTLEIINSLSKENEKINVVSNKKNLGPGKSMELGVAKALELGSEFIVKIDGDDQFDSIDIENVLKIGQKNKSDFIKCDRFWPGGIEGEIPKIRYLGNAFASFLVKVSSGNRNINDPLNGLFLFSKKLAEKIKIPKLFNRYGYPFFINLLITKLSIDENLNLHQYRNKITYADEKSSLNPVTVLFKLLFYSIYFSISNTKVKLRFSQYQISALLDIFGYINFLLSLFSLIMFINIRFFTYQGNQNTWFLLFILFFIIFVVLIIQSHKAIKSFQISKFIYLD